MTSPILQHLRRMVDDERTKGRSDQELLAEFVTTADEAAFQALVRRHGPMVLDVCRAVLTNEADAEDAFQATFVVLARKADSIRKAVALASWLHGVAHRVALAARRGLLTRSRHETCVPPRESVSADDLSWREAQVLLHEELDRLGERHRAPLVLCYLQGKTQDEAAETLGMAKSTLKLRLEQARAHLRTRLVRRGLGPVCALLAAAWPAATASAGVPSGLLHAATKAGMMVRDGAVLAAVVSPSVASLAQGMLRMTLYRSLATVFAGALVLALFGMGVACLAWPGRSAAPDPAAQLTLVPQNAVPQPRLTQDIDRFAAQLKARNERRNGADDALGIFLMDMGKGDVSLIATQVDQERAYCGSPCWSSDGRSILFDGSPGKNFDDSRLHRLATTEAGLAIDHLGAGNCPTLSPDGKQIAYLVNRPADTERGVWVMRADGTEPRRLGSYGIPKWSPDGQRLLIVSFTSPCKLSMLDVTTGNERPIEFEGHQVYSVPSWATATTLTAVVRSNKGLSISLVEVGDQGTAKIKEMLWTRGDRLSVEPAYPVYSPHSRRCMFVGRDKQGQALYGFEHGKGEAPRRLEPGLLDRKIASLTLSPDGRYLLFCSDRSWPRLPGGAGR